VTVCRRAGSPFLGRAAEYHPGNENPTTASAIVPIAALDTAGFPGMDFHFVTSASGEKGFSRLRSTGDDKPRRGGNNSLGNYSDDLAGIDLAGRSAPS
jgi:hypothetical protein